MQGISLCYQVIKWYSIERNVNWKERKWYLISNTSELGIRTAGLIAQHFFNRFVLHGPKALLNQAHDIKSPETDLSPVWEEKYTSDLSELHKESEFLHLGCSLTSPRSSCAIYCILLQHPRMLLPSSTSSLLLALQAIYEATLKLIFPL